MSLPSIRLLSVAWASPMEIPSFVLAEMMLPAPAVDAADRIAGRPEDLDADTVGLGGGAIGRADITALNQVVSARREHDPRAGQPTIASPWIVLDPAVSQRTQSDAVRSDPSITISGVPE